MATGSNSKDQEEQKVPTTKAFASKHGDIAKLLSTDTAPPTAVAQNKDGGQDKKAAFLSGIALGFMEAVRSDRRGAEEIHAGSLPPPKAAEPDRDDGTQGLGYNVEDADEEEEGQDGANKLGNNRRMLLSNPEVREAMVAPKRGGRGQGGSSSNGKNNKRNYYKKKPEEDESSDEDIGRSGLGRKKVRAG